MLKFGSPVHQPETLQATSKSSIRNPNRLIWSNSRKEKKLQLRSPKIFLVLDRAKVQAAVLVQTLVLKIVPVLMPTPRKRIKGKRMDFSLGKMRYLLLNNPVPKVNILTNSEKAFSFEMSFFVGLQANFQKIVQA